MAEQFTAVMAQVSLLFEIAGVSAIVIGFVAALVLAISAVARTREWTAAYETLRSTFGRSVLLGLEILVAADLIEVGEGDFRRLFDFPAGRATDLAVSAGNPAEIPTIAAQIVQQMPDTRPVLKSEIGRMVG